MVDGSFLVHLCGFVELYVAGHKGLGIGDLCGCVSGHKRNIYHSQLTSVSKMIIKLISWVITFCQSNLSTERSMPSIRNLYYV